MLVYLLCILSSCIFAFLAKNAMGGFGNKLWLVVVSLFIPTFVAGFRYKNGTDYDLYTEIFNVMLTGEEFVSVKKLEIGFVSLVRFSQLISSDPAFMFLLCAAIINTFFFIGCWKMSANFSVSVLLFFITGTFFDSFNGLRQYIAASIVFIGYLFLIRKETTKYVLSILVATLFHYSALIMLPLYFIFKLRFNIKILMYIIPLFIFGGIAFFEIFTNILLYTRYAYFVSSIEYKVVVTLGSISYTSVVTVFYLYEMYKSKYLITERQKILFSIQVIILLSALSSLFVPLSARLQYYFLPMEMIVIPEIIAIAPKKTKKIVGILLVLMYVVIVGYGMMFNNWYDCLPYNFYFD